MTVRILQSSIVRALLFVVAGSAVGLAVACGSVDSCDDPALAMTATARPWSGDAPSADDPQAVPSSSADPYGSDPCESPAPQATARSTGSRSCNCTPGDPLCSCL